MRLHAVAAPCVALVLSLAGARARGAPRVTAGRLDATLAGPITRAMAQARVPGLQVAVLIDGAVVWSRGFGLADVETGTRVTPQTVLQAGSISKLFTATLVLEHVERGELRLDEDVNRYLPAGSRIRDPKGRPVRVTIRQLLSHRSGLPSFGAGVSFLRAVAILTGIVPVPSYQEVASSGYVLRRTPGTALRYSNEAYILLGWLCGQLARKPFAAYVREKILEPLGMASSDFQPDAPRLRRRLASIYAVAGDGWKKAHPYPGVWPSGSLHTTAEDLLRFARMVLQGGVLAGRRLLRKETLAEMTHLQSRPTSEAWSGFGLGFRITRYGGRRVLCHEGGNPGIAARLCMVPGENIAAALLINVNNEDAAYVMLNRVLDVLLGTADDINVAAAPPLPDTWRRIVGRYRPVDMGPDQLWFLEPLTQITIERTGSELTAHIPGSVRRVLVPTADPLAFRIRGGQGDGETMWFREDEEGRLNGYAAVYHVRKLPAYAGLPVLVAGAVGAGVVMLGALIILARRRWRSAAGAR